MIKAKPGGPPNNVLSQKFKDRIEKGDKLTKHQRTNLFFLCEKLNCRGNVFSKSRRDLRLVSKDCHINLLTSWNM